jgi:hypothetical protein
MLGGSAMKNHPAYHWLRKIVKALVASWRSLSNTCQFSLESHEARLTVGKAKILGVRLTKRLSKYLEIQMRHTHRFTYDLSSWSSREVHQANERVLHTSNKIAQKTSSFCFTYYYIIIVAICKRNISSRDKVFHNYSYFLQKSTNSSSLQQEPNFFELYNLSLCPATTTRT